MKLIDWDEALAEATEYSVNEIPEVEKYDDLINREGFVISYLQQNFSLVRKTNG
jgi:hypothetical protein